MSRHFKVSVNKETPALTDVESECPECHNITTFQVPTQGWANYVMGQLIHLAMPTVSEDNREILLTGICKTCWDAMFNFEDFESEFNGEVPD